MGLWAEMGVMEEDPPEVGHQAVDVHQSEALEVAVGAPQLEDQAVDVHQLEVLEVEVDRQAEAGLEMVPEVQELVQELVGARTFTLPLMATIKQWQKLPRVSQVPQPPARHKVPDAAAVATTTPDSPTTARLSLAAQEV